MPLSYFLCLLAFARFSFFFKGPVMVRLVNV